jgi:hypothetical protein
MRCITFALAIGLVVGPPAGAADKEPARKELTAAEKAFRDNGEFIVGGSWSGTDAKGNEFKVHAEWILNKSFVRTVGEFAGDAYTEIHGIDPVSGRYTYWGFDSKGRVWKGVVETSKPGEWMLRESGQGKAGAESAKYKVVRLGKDKYRLEFEEYILDGKKQETSNYTMTRKRK